MEEQRQDSAENDGGHPQREVGVAKETDEESAPHNLPANHGGLPAVVDEVSGAGKDQGHSGVCEVIVGCELDNRPDDGERATIDRNRQ